MSWFLYQVVTLVTNRWFNCKTLGLPIKRFIASTNANDTVPRYLESGNWAPKATVATLSNAMDVSRPNNWPRVEELFKRNGWNLSDLGSGMLSDGETEETLKAMYAKVIYVNHTVRSPIKY